MHPWFRTLVLIGIFTSLLAGQSVTGTIAGAVSDSQNNPIVQASIIIVNSATDAKVAVVTDKRGGYVSPLLFPGSYSVAVSAAGFQNYQHDGIQLAIGEQIRLNVVLELGVITDSVVVHGVTSVLEPTVSSVDANVDNRKVMELPLNTRNVYSLVLLTPGVYGSIGNQHNNVSYSVNGTRTGFFSTLIDGAPADFPTVNGLSGLSLFPSVDAVDEFRLQAQNYPAEFGRTMTGVMNLIFKSGGNAVHGSAYEFLRNSAMDANTFFNNGRGIPLASFKRNQFGGTLSGPIRRDRTFFLLAYEGLRQKNFRDLLATVPTTAQRSGDFSQTRASATQPILLYDPETTVGTTRQPFVGNLIPLTRWDPVARNILQYFPAANLPGDAATQLNNYYASGGAAVDTDNADVRIDHDLNRRMRISGRFSYRHSLDAPPQLFPGDLGVAEGRVNQNDFGRNAVLNFSDAVSGSTLWNVRLSLARNRFLFDNQGLGFAPSTLGFPKAFDSAVDRLMFPRIEVDGQVPLGGGDHRQSGFNNFTLSAALSKFVSRHSLKAGYDGRLIRDNVWEARAAGTFQFNSAFTQGPDATTASAAAGYGLASFLLGTGSGGNFYQNWKNVATQSLYHAFYLQDDWHVTRKLTLNVGLRYDFDTPRTERYNRMSWFDPNLSSPLASQVSAFPDLRGGLQFVGVGGNGRSQFPGDYNNVAPRLGFAYQVDDRTVVRGAWGQSFGPSTIAAQGTVGPYGFRVETPWVTSLDNGLTPYNKLQNPFPGGFPPVPGASAGALTAVGGNVEGPLRNTVTPYTLQWNFTIQRELPAHTLLQIAYVGNRGRQLSRGGETGFTLNQIDPKYLSLGAALNDRVDNPFYGIITTGALSAPQVSRAQLLRPFPQFLSVIPYFSPGATSDYNALQLTVSRRLAGGLALEGNYTWSKSMDTGTSYQNSYDVLNNRAVSGVDIPHRLVITGLYELPLGATLRQSKTWSAILGQWHLNGFWTLQSGSPLGISARNTSGLFTEAFYANATGISPTLSGDAHDRLNQWFNPAAFSQPAPFTLGNLSPLLSSVRNDRLNNFDLSLFKEILLHERIKMQFRVEAYNAFNHVRFGNPNLDVNAGSSFGRVTSQANSPRQMQLGLKFLW